MNTFFEFFAGAGMARIGLGPEWRCAFANDISAKKAEAYHRNFRGAEQIFRLDDIKNITTHKLPGRADLVWGSFPCQDLSVAGSGSGLAGSRSGLIWQLLELAKQLKNEGRAARAIVLENVPGLLNSRGGLDLESILQTIQSMGYVVGVLSMDAARFLPHSRQRLFIVAVEKECIAVAPWLVRDRTPASVYEWSSSRLDAVWDSASPSSKRDWVWWSLPSPPHRYALLHDVVEADCADWDAPAYTARLLGLMSDGNLEKIRKAGRMGKETVGCAYRRTRAENGVRQQRVEVRFDGLSGCIRTATGGSSRQRLIFVEGRKVRSRLMTPREAVRLMGVPDDYVLPTRYNEAYQLAGDGVAVPVVRWLAAHLLEPMLDPSLHPTPLPLFDSSRMARLHA